MSLVKTKEREKPKKGLGMGGGGVGGDWVCCSYSTVLYSVQHWLIS